MRYGLVATTVGFYLNDMIAPVPPAVDFTAWYAPLSLIPIVAALALLAYGFHISLAGQPLFGTGNLLDE